MTERAQPLRVYLLKTSVKDFKDALKSHDELTQYNLRDDISYEGELYVAPSSETHPFWRQFLESITALSLDDLVNRHNSAVLFIKIARRIFAIVFGYGRTLLEPNVYERDFGLRIVMNVVDPEKLRSIDAHTMEEIPVQTRRQASKASALEIFGINIFEDMLRAVTGTPKDILPDNTKPNLGKTVSGSSSVSVRPNLEIKNLGLFCNKLKALYNKKYYKDNGFGWVDNLAIVKDPDLIKKLDNKLLESIRAKESDKIHLAPPEPINWDELECFKYSCDRGRGEYEDIDIIDFYNVCGEPSSLSTDELNGIKINICFTGGGVDLSRFSLYQCIVFDTSYYNKQYVLTNSMWFEINKSFGDSILRYITRLAESKIKLPDAKKGEKEGEYNERAVKSSQRSFILMDKKTVKPTDGRTPIEVCDIFSKEKQFVHVKRYKGSSTLSHLFAQGTVSADLFQNDKGFRKRFRQKMGKSSQKLTSLIPDGEPNTREYSVVYAIIKKATASSKKWQYSLPFFAQLHLMQSAKRLHSQGYGVEVKLIKRI